MLKVCSVCGVEKPATTEFFHLNKGGKYGLRGQCRECRKIVIRSQIQLPHNCLRRAQIAAEYVASGRNAARNRAWRRKNPESALASKRRWSAKNADKLREAGKKYRDKNRERCREKQRRADAKAMENPAHVLKCRMKKRISGLLRGKAGVKTEELLGYTKEQLMRHIERQFTTGMNWEKLLNGEIHIDHIIPVSSFKSITTDLSELKACWALTNLRPLWAKDNYAKSNKVLTLL